MKIFNYEKYANYTRDSEILGLVAKIHEYKGRQELLMAQKPIVLDRLVTLAKIQSVESSNKIEGIVTTQPRIRDLCLDKIAPKSRDEMEIKGYKEVLNLIYENYESINLNRNNLLQLHKILYQFVVSGIGGRFKNVPNYINQTDEEGNSIVRFMPLEPYLVPDAIDDICQKYNQEIDKENIDPLLLIPIFISDFLCIHPFTDGNGRMSRLLTTLLLERSGFYIGKYISLEKKIEETKDIYYDVLSESSRGWHENKNDPTPYIKYLLKIILAAYRDLEDRVEVVNGKGKAVEVIEEAIKTKIIGKFTRKDILELCPSLERSSVADALKKLVKKSFIKREGQGRNTYYYKTK